MTSTPQAAAPQVAVQDAKLPLVADAEKEKKVEKEENKEAAVEGEKKKKHKKHKKAGTHEIPILDPQAATAIKPTDRITDIAPASSTPLSKAVEAHNTVAHQQVKEAHNPTVVEAKATAADESKPVKEADHEVEKPAAAEGETKAAAADESKLVKEADHEVENSVAAEGEAQTGASEVAAPPNENKEAVDADHEVDKPYAEDT